MKDDTIPSLQTVIEGIKTIDKVLLTNDFEYTFTNLKDLFMTNLQILPTLVIPDYDHSIYLHRVRLIDPTKDSISKVSDFAEPPADACDIYRANLKGYPVMYCSLSATTAINEVRVNGQPITEGQEFFLSVWELKPGAILNILQYLFEKV